MRNKKGFTLIELLAVIVILGLLLAIAIPSITKYIVESRKKTVVSSIDGYMSSVIASVNNQEYNFTTPNTIYAVPIECISLEKGGKNPLGEWLQANDDYWAYVLVQYDSENFSYNHGFTFKDSNGYGMYPTSYSQLNKQGNQIQTGLELTRPQTDKVTTITSVDNWSGFKVDSETNLVVLEAENEEKIGDGENTCTLCQKGSNYQEVENEKNKQLINRIKNDNPVIKGEPNLTTSFDKTNDASGLYVSTDTNSGKATYYFRGVRKYVKFAGETWLIVRVNEDGSIRLMLKKGIGHSIFSLNYSTGGMYYSNSDAKIKADNWYKTQIIDNGYDLYVSNGVFCEAVKVTFSSYHTGGKANTEAYTDYVPDFKCLTDGNGKGILNSKVGLITIDELVFSGYYYVNSTFDLFQSEVNYWTMSSAGHKAGTQPIIWTKATFGAQNCNNSAPVVPVINIKGDVLATGTGTSTDPYVIQTN